MDESLYETDTLNYRRFQDGRQYLGKKGLLSLIPLCVRFLEGDQWEKVTPRTQFIPRPVINFVAKIVDNKSSNILGAPVHLNFRADNDDESTERFTKFASYQMKEMQMEYYDSIACHDGLAKGTYCYYFYWDDSAVGRRGTKEGSLRCEVIDPLNIVFENPMQVDCQKQKWIIVKTREDVDAIKEICDDEETKKRIHPDDMESDYAGDIEQEGNNLVTVYTRFFRKDNEVYFEKSTQYANIHKPRAMNPNINEELLKKREKEIEKDDEEFKDSTELYDIDSAKPTNTDSKLSEESEQEFKEEQMKFYYYPFEVGSLTPRDKCIYGISEIAGIIQSQRAVNFQYSMILLNAQQMGWGKILVKKDALKGQSITNKPGQVIVDHSPLGHWGVTMLQGQQFSNGAFEVANQLIEATRNVTNSTDVITGDMISKDLSGTAIAQMQAQGQKPIEQMQKRFWRSKERIGKILEQYYKLFYEDAEYTYEISNAEYERRYAEMKAMQAQYGDTRDLPSIPMANAGVFNGMDFQKTPFNIVVEAGKGTQYSEIMQMDFVNTLIMNGNIDNISPENLMLLIKLYPDPAIPNKADLLRFIRNKENSEINVLRGKLEEAYQLLEKANQELGRRGGQIEQLGNYTQALKKEFASQMANANNQIRDMTNFMQQKKDAKKDGLADE